MATYRDKLQDLIRSVWGIYDQVGPLRDASTNKELFNAARGRLYEAAIVLIMHDDGLDSQTATMEI